MVAIFSNLTPGEELTIPVEVISARLVEGQLIISDATDEYIVGLEVLGKGCTFTSVDFEDYVGTGISVFSFKRDYCNA